MVAFSYIATVVAVVASTLWLATVLWRKVYPAKTLPGIPLVEFDGDNSRDRYTKEAASLLVKGYDNSSTLSQVGGPSITDEIQTSARLNLNHALNKLIEPMQISCFQAAAEVMPDCPDWTSVVMYPNILELFSRMSACVMVGPELSDKWPAISLKYINRVLAAQGAIRKKYYPALYWTAAYFNPEVAAVNHARREAAELVRPTLEAREADHAANRENAEKHDDFIQWIMENYRANGKTITPDETVQNIFIVMFASMHGTSFIALQSLFSLLGTTGAVAEVREEIERVSKEELENSHLWTRHALSQLRTMDSFMKETLRTKPFQEATVQRVSMAPYIFKDGLSVPENTVISFPNLRFNLDPSRDGPGANAAIFHGKRWLESRTGFNTSKYQFASTADDSFDWGGGLHACPGRFMADVTIKLMLICLITRYDMKLVEGREERPAEARRFLDMAPDTSMPIMVSNVKS